MRENMFMSTSMTKILFAAAAILAIAGVILFFPINFSDEHTCLLDYIVHAAATVSDPNAPHAHPSELLGRYLVPYGLLWWSSILAVVVVAIAWKRRAVKLEKLMSTNSTRSTTVETVQ